MGTILRVVVTVVAVVAWAYLRMMETAWQAQIALQQLQNSNEAVAFGRYVATNGFMGWATLVLAVFLVCVWLDPIRKLFRPKSNSNVGNGAR